MLTTAVAYTKRVNGGATLGSITASFPNANGTNFNAGTGVAQVLKLDRYDWDVMLHEYGHFISRKMAFNASPGGSHSSSQNLGETSARTGASGSPGARASRRTSPSPPRTSSRSRR